MEGFNKLYPDVTVNITVVPNADFIAKLTPTLAGGQGAPDIFTGESDYVKYLVESGFWDDLKGDPYNADTSDVWEYISSVGTDSNGVLRALSWQASPGSVMYRRDMARDVLGTDDPDEVAALLNSNEAMLDVAATDLVGTPSSAQVGRDYCDQLFAAEKKIELLPEKDQQRVNG